MKIKLLFFLGLFILSISMISSANYSWRLYDDFSSGSLDTNKWIEYKGFQVNIFTDEHFVNATEGAYHINQSVQGDRETNLKPNRSFTSGEAFSYQVLYKGGSGNHFSQPLINGNYPPTQIEPCLAPGGCGPIGFWNGVPDFGAQIGIYNITYEFSSNQVKMNATRPDGISIVNTFTGNSEPYNLSINTHTGNNGLMHFDFDNFKLYRLNSVPALSLIPNQTWDEDTTLTINLTAYSSDLDEDDLNWSYSPLNNIIITIDNNTGIATLVPNSNWFGVEYVIFTATDNIDNANSNNITLIINDVAESSSSSGGGGGGGGGGSSIKYYKCSEWGEWSICNNNQQTRVCLKNITTTSSQGVIESKFNKTEIRTCTQTLTPLINLATEELENNVNETEKESSQKSESFRAGITGAITGFSKTKGGKLFLIVLGVLVLGWIALAFRKKK